jgi:hypothetical protein
VLSDRNQNHYIRQWAMGKADSREWSVLHARLRDDPVPGSAKSSVKKEIAAA